MYYVMDILLAYLRQNKNKLHLQTSDLRAEFLAVHVSGTILSLPYYINRLTPHPTPLYAGLYNFLRRV